jgi:hypothetical protein
VIVGSLGTLFIKVKVMTENTPKKPRRKRRTKAQIEAEKTVKAPKEVKNDNVVVEMLEESVTSVAPAKEAIAESAEPVHYEETPFNGMSKMRRKMMERRLRSDLR